MSELKVPNIGDAAAQYLDQLDTARRRQARGEVTRFVRWFSADQTMDRLRPHEVEGFAASLSATDTDNARKLDQVRAFLNYARKQDWVEINLSIHMKLKRAPRRKTRSSAGMRQRPAVVLSIEGRAELGGTEITIGPDPISIILCISVRLGIYSPEFNLIYTEVLLFLFFFIDSMNSSNRYSASCGPGHASG